MKKNIIILSVVLAAVLTLTGCGINFSVGVNYSYDGKGYERFEENTVKTFDGTVQKVDMDWIAGKISFVRGDTFSITEKALKGDYFPLYYKLEAGTLYIRWAEDGTSSKLLKNREKEITVTVTEDFGAVSLNNVSAQFDIDVYHADKLDIKTVSGGGTVKADTVKEIRLDCVSGDIELESEITGSADINAVSGKTVIRQKKAAPVSFKINTVSGSAELVFPSDLAGYKTKISTVSGTAKSDFGSSEYGDGSTVIDFNSVSADLKITKAE